jgi:1,2-diacylglycerol 3-beta-galactosyltransferase
MSDTGGGHRASANALRDAFDVLYPGKIQCDIVDIYTDYGPFWPFNDYVNGYKIMAEYSFLWEAFFYFGTTDFGLCLNDWLLTTFCFEPFKECLNRPSGTTSKRADMVVSVHPLCQDLPLKILADLDTNGKSRDPKDRTTPFATVVTDLGGAHPTWFNKGVDKCYVPTDVLYDCARDRKLEPSQLVEFGLPIRKGFWSTEHAPEESLKKDRDTAKEKAKLRQQLGLEEGLPTVLMVGGGDGMGGIVDIAKSLGRKLGSSADEARYQMVVVCGNNKAAKSTLSSVEWGKGVKVQVQGFVNNMDEWMKASDALVTKAGPGTIAEASICGLPCMLFNYLPGQEEGNVPYVENAGFGKYSGNPTVIADTVTSWLASPEKLEVMRDAALVAARPSATLDIARDLAEMVFATKKTAVAV